MTINLFTIGNSYSKVTVTLGACSKYKEVKLKKPHLGIKLSELAQVNDGEGQFFSILIIDGDDWFIMLTRFHVYIPFIRPKLLCSVPFLFWTKAVFVVA